MNVHEYSVASLTLCERNKSTSAIAKEAEVSQSAASRFLAKADMTINDFKHVVKNMFGEKAVTCVIDDFTISKRYSRIIEGTSSMVDQATKTFTTGYKLLMCGLTNGKHFLPIDMEQWIAEFILKKDYLKITCLAKKLVQRILDSGIKVNYFVFDGLYFCEEFMNFLNYLGVMFVMKAKTTTSVSYQGEKVQLRNCKALRLNSNQSCKTIRAKWKGEIYNFTAVRRSGKRGETIIYLIANFKTKAKIYKKIYDSRWVIEKSIRTCKQSLGIGASSSQNATVYRNHIKCVFLAYCKAQVIMKKFRLHSAEEAIRKTQALKRTKNFLEITQQISLLVGYA